MGDLPWWHRPCRLLMPGLDRQMVRLEAEIKALGIRIGKTTLPGGNPPSADEAAAQQALQRARAFHDVARAAAARCDVEGGWRAVHDAEENLLETLGSHALKWEAAHIRQRCNHFTKGKRDLIMRLVDEKDLGRVRLAEQRMRVRKAAEMRFNHWENQYQETGVRAARVALLGLALAAGLALVVLLADADRIDPFGDSCADGGGLVAGVVVFGMIGGATSSVLAAVAGERRLPEQARDGPWHLARPLFGAAAGLVVTVAIASGLLGVEVTSSTAYLAWAAAGGFSEILLVGAMKRIADSGDAKATSKEGGEGGASKPGDAAGDADAEPAKRFVRRT